MTILLILLALIRRGTSTVMLLTALQVASHLHCMSHRDHGCGQDHLDKLRKQKKQEEQTHTSYREMSEPDIKLKQSSRTNRFFLFFSPRLVFVICNMQPLIALSAHGTRGKAKPEKGKGLERVPPAVE